MALDISKVDLYALFEVSEEASDKEIVKAYRKKALKCHPDKNPDNPRAAEEFQQISKALEILTDAAARAAYDKVQKAKKAAAERHRVLDSKRKKLKEDLEARERAAQSENVSRDVAQKNLEAEIARLRKEGSKLLETEQEYLREQLKKNVADVEENKDEAAPPRLRVRWNAKKCGDYSSERLEQIFSKYGTISALVKSTKKQGSAVVEFERASCADLASQTETGDPGNPLTLTWLSGKPRSQASSGVFAAAAQPPNSSTYQPWTSQERDYESIVLMKMRQAEERKKLIEQMKKEDEDE